MGSQSVPDYVRIHRLPDEVILGYVGRWRRVELNTQLRVENMNPSLFDYRDGNDRGIIW